MFARKVNCDAEPVGAELARDKGAANIRQIASSLIASKLCSHRICVSLNISKPSRHQPLPLTLPLAKWLQVLRIARDAVIVNVFAIRHIGDLCVAANSKRSNGALLQERHIGFLPSELRLAKAVVKQLGRYVAIGLTDFHVQPLGLAVYQTRLGPCVSCTRCQ